jgi:hypothetical protein
MTLASALALSQHLPIFLAICSLPHSHTDPASISSLLFHLLRILAILFAQDVIHSDLS